MYRIFIIAVLAAITTQASALTFKTTSTDEDQSAIMDGAGNTDASVTIEAIGGREIEAGGVSLNYPPLFPSALTDRYFFGLFWTQQDFNQDGHLDFIYTATMRPTNTEIIGKNTAGICGGGRHARPKPVFE